jgi:sensor c-di-GMP phosphodiesterase-like protein
VNINTFLLSIGLLTSIVNLCLLIRSMMNLKKIERNLRQAKAAREAWVVHFRALQTDEDRVASLRVFLQEI